MSNEVNSGIVLAAGQERRFGKPYPKGLGKVNNESLISRTIDSMWGAGVREIVVVTNIDFFEHYQTWLSEVKSKGRRYAEAVRIVNNQRERKDPLGAIGDFRFGVEKSGWVDENGVPNRNILLVPSDTHFSKEHFNMRMLVDLYGKNGGVVTVGYRAEPERLSSLGCIILDNDEMIDFLEKPENPPEGDVFASAPFSIFSINELRMLWDLMSEYEEKGKDRFRLWLENMGNLLGGLIELKKRGESVKIRVLAVNDLIVDVASPEILRTITGEK